MRLLKAGDFRINVDEIVYTYWDGVDYLIYFKNKEHVTLRPSGFNELIANMSDATDLTWPQ